VDDVLVDLVDHFAHAPKRAAPDGVLGDEPESALNLVEPTGVGRRVMDDERGRRASQALTRGCLWVA